MIGTAHSSPIVSGAAVLIALDVVEEVLAVEAGVGVVDEVEREGIDARVAGQWPVGQARQPRQVAGGEILDDLAELLLDDVEVVEQPLLRGTRSRRSRATASIDAYARQHVVARPTKLVEERAERSRRAGADMARGEPGRVLGEVGRLKISPVTACWSAGGAASGTVIRPGEPERRQRAALRPPGRGHRHGRAPDTGRGMSGVWSTSPIA